MNASSISDPCEKIRCPTYQVCQLDENRNPNLPLQLSVLQTSDPCVAPTDDYANECALRSEEPASSTKTFVSFYSGDCSSSSNPCELIKCGPGQECDVDRYGVASCQCPPTCEPRMQPICGSNGRTFDNECELKRQSCLLRQELTGLHEGECGNHGPCHTHHCSYGAMCVVKNGQPVCECPTCAEEFEPVCGTDSISYTNPCKLKREACEQKTGHHNRSRGLCSNDSINLSPFQLTDKHQPLNPHPLTFKGTYRASIKDGTLSTRTSPRTDSLSVTEGYSNLQVYPVHFWHPLYICSTQQCDFYAVCESFGKGETRCVCPEVCIKVDAPVCGTDGVSYPNECELRVEACKRRQYIAVATKGPCELCEHVHCKYGARCESGRCVCPVDCPKIYEFICATDGKTYINECEMKRSGCQKSRDLAIQFYGTCGEATDGSDDEEDLPALKERKISSCQDKQCKYGGICDFNSEGSPFCVCTFHCPSIKGACLWIRRGEYHVDIACDGEPPVIDPATGKDYYCGTGSGSKLCPARTVCHLTQYFAKCCNVAPLVKSCEATPFGCCPDLRHPVMGPEQRRMSERVQLQQFGLLQLDL
ncbi:hypothetical protein CEXT_695391 [Caerostris extrusa]|uniref:Kazal-like domain-containing protein n=1 Tax=Caerostris extrusa TaxID=172846 RepID=A0AAV4MAW2_CAEEX|nr:hypothetical protein CEXT_695391 [Caerostris extrusa]